MDTDDNIIIFKLSPEGKFSFVSETITKFGFTSNELVGKHFSVIVHPEDFPKVNRISKSRGFAQAFDERRTGLRSTKNLQLRLLPKHEITSDYYVRVDSSGVYDRDVFDKNKRFLGTIGCIKLNHENVALSNEMIKLEKMAAIGSLAFNLCHEFKNLSQMMLGNAQLMVKCDDIKEIHESLDVILSAANRSAGLCKHILEYAQPGKTEKTVCNMNECIEKIVSMVGFLFKTNNIILTKNYDEKFDVLVNMGEIEQVLLNLVINACDSMTPRGGMLEISIDRKDGWIETKIKDTGYGISSENLSKIFTPFFTTQNYQFESFKMSGNGLGLSVANDIVKRYNGSIEVESELGQGSTFTVRLPSAGINA
jgi:signal transduction histidine kinase